MKRYRVYCASDVGQHRCNNEDNFYVNGCFRKDLQANNFSHEYSSMDGALLIAAVFDGMGGADLGEQASLLSAQSLFEYVNVNHECFDINTSIVNMNNAVCDASRINSNNMGSTVVMLVCKDGMATVCNVGDSRAYLLRNEQLRQLSFDHTEKNVSKQMMLELGLDACCAIPNNSNMLTQHLGVYESDFVIEPYISECIKLQNKDVFLLCSDGLTDMVDETTILSILLQNLSEKEKVELLIETANCAGGKDNITTMIICVEGEQL